MIDKLQVFALLAIFLCSVNRCSSMPIEAEACSELCKSCNGVASFSNGKCECRVSQDDKEGARCIQRMKREAEVLGLGLVSCDTATENRPARCICDFKSPYTKGDVERVANYFHNDGPRKGSIFDARIPDLSKHLLPTHEIVGITKPKSYVVKQPIQLIVQPKDSQKEEHLVSSPAKSVDCDDSVEVKTPEIHSVPVSAPVIGMPQVYRTWTPNTYNPQPQVSYSRASVPAGLQFYVSANTPLVQRTVNVPSVNVNPIKYSQPLPVQMTYRIPQAQNANIPLRLYSVVPTNAVGAIQSPVTNQEPTKTCTCPDNTVVTIGSRSVRHADDCPEKKLVKKSAETSTTKKVRDVKSILDTLAAENKPSYKKSEPNM